MNYIFHDLIGQLVEIYINELVVKSGFQENHLANLHQVLQRTRKHGLKLNPNKCAFGVTAGQFLDFMIHERGIEIRDKSKDAITSMVPPTNKVELQSLIRKIIYVHQKVYIKPLRKNQVVDASHQDKKLPRLRVGPRSAGGVRQYKIIFSIATHAGSTADRQAIPNLFIG
jgi:Tfp pilus assembly pilus retraction ATPase PilT